ncbi:MAG: DUF177 domain-containing protein [Chitinivibrionia bacterium]|nr:DUF177 domain-containing protein [Chitinivibrionia bacterium]
MIIDFEKLTGTEDGLSADETFHVRDFQGEENAVPCRLDIMVRRSGDLYYLTVDILGALATFCHKCLDPVHHRLETSFDLVVQRGGANKAEEFEEALEEYVYLPAGKHELSLDAHIYENLIVSIPMQILCRDDCKGLCTECGVNLNLETCNCVRETDHRRHILHKLKNRYDR